MALLLALLAIMIKRSSLPEINMEKQEAGSTPLTEKTSVFQFPHLWLAVLCLFLYVGVEVMAGDAIGTYGKELGMPLDQTKYFTTLTLFSMLAGYVIGIFTIPKYISQQKALSFSAIAGIIFSFCAFIATGYTAIVFIALLGLANALMWPAIFPLAIKELGKFTKIGSAFLIMGIAGGALLPLLYTTLKDRCILSNHAAFLVCTLPCYFYIFYYAVKGFRVRKMQNSKSINKVALYKL